MPDGHERPTVEGVSTPVREYRVVFEHCRHRTRFEVAVHALNMDVALEAATTILESQLDTKAGAGQDWTHKETVELDG